MLSEGTPDKQQLEGRLVEILHRISGADPAVITPEARLMEDIGIDSLGFYEILIEADTCFGLKPTPVSAFAFRKSSCCSSRRWVTSRAIWSRSTSMSAAPEPPDRGCPATIRPASFHCWLGFRLPTGR